MIRIYLCVDVTIVQEIKKLKVFVGSGLEYLWMEFGMFMHIFPSNNITVKQLCTLHFQIQHNNFQSEQTIPTFFIKTIFISSTLIPSIDWLKRTDFMKYFMENKLGLIHLEALRRMFSLLISNFGMDWRDESKQNNKIAKSSPLSRLAYNATTRLFEWMKYF